MEIRPVFLDSAHYRQAVALRDSVLRAPLGLTLTAEELAQDAGREHFAAMREEQILGCVSLYLKESGIVRIKQMAVAPEAQGMGVGAALLQAAEARGKALGAVKARLHARCSAQIFYQKQGYIVRGAVFLEQGIDHVVMEKQL